MNIQFIDTNILLYAHDRDAGPRQVRSADLVVELTETNTGAVSTQVLIEFYSIATRKMKMFPAEAELAIQALGQWAVHRPSHSDVLHAIRLQQRHRMSWWDALIVTSAQQLDCSVLWTEDLQHGQGFGSLTVKNPFR